MFTFVLINTGGKGATLATAVCALLPLLVGLRVTRRKIFYKRYQIWIIWLVVALVVGLSIVVATSERTPRSLQRLSGMVEDGELQGTAALRLEAYQHALRFWPEAPLLGHGAGSWPILNGIPDRPSTPHNMFLEIAVEVGFVGLVLMVMLLVVALHPLSIDRLRNDPLALCAFMLFVWAFMKAQSGPRYCGKSDHVHAARRVHRAHGAKAPRRVPGPASARPAL